MTFPALLLPAAGKSYIDSWPIYARHVVCVKFPFGTPRRMRLLLLLLLWQDDPFSAPLHHLLTRPRTHTHTAILQHTHSETAHTLPLSTAIPWHNHSLWLCGAAIGSARARLVALAGHALPVLPQRGCGLLRECVCECVCELHAQRSRCLAHFSPGCVPMAIHACPFWLLHSLPSSIGCGCGSSS